MAPDVTGILAILLVGIVIGFVIGVLTGLLLAIWYSKRAERRLLEDEVRRGFPVDAAHSEHR